MDVDRFHRDQYAELLRHFAAGGIVNDDYVDSAHKIIARTNDPAVDELWWQSWFWYDDLKRHCLTGKHALSSEGRKLAARMIVFLHSDFPYEYPAWSRGLGCLFAILTLGVWRRLFPAEPHGGDSSVWPFFREADFDAARDQPRLLARP